MDQIDTLFDLLDAWRHLPKYQLERRADIYFALYLVEALEARFGVPFRPELIPEFPVRIGTVERDTETNRSYCIDYVALAAAGDKAVFVELKTDTLSRRLKQDEYLLAAQQVGLRRLLEGVLAIFRATRARRKYFYLLAELEKMGLLRIPARMHEGMAGSGRVQLHKLSRQIEIAETPVAVEIVYVQPRGEGDRVISFAEFAQVVNRHDDRLSQRFARALREWADGPA